MQFDRLDASLAREFSKKKLKTHMPLGTVAQRGELLPIEEKPLGGLKFLELRP
jgi:hypothetical protein